MARATAASTAAPITPSIVASPTADLVEYASEHSDHGGAGRHDTCGDPERGVGGDAPAAGPAPDAQPAEIASELRRRAHGHPDGVRRAPVSHPRPRRSGREADRPASQPA